MDTSTIELQVDGPVARLTLNRPDVRNAFNETMIRELGDAMRALGADPKVRVVVLGAAGRAFCAGADLNWMRRMAGFSEAENVADALQLAEMLEAIHVCPKPVVAAVHGDCYAGGIGLVAACDVAFAADTAHFCLSEVRLGLIPATISPYVLSAIGARAARRYFLSAERFDAAEACRIGLVHEVTAAGAPLMDKVAAFAQGLLDNSPAALAEAKRLIRDIAKAPLDAAVIADTARRIAGARASAEGREGVGAFLEKRKPFWVPSRPPGDGA